MLPREQDFQKLLRTAKVVDRRIVQHELFPADKDGSVARDFLRGQVQKGWARRFGPTNDFTIHVAPVYHPTEAGCAVLATDLNDMRWLLDSPPRIHPQDIPHALARTRLIIDLMKALAAQDYVEMPQLYTELDVFPGPKGEPMKLYQQVQDAPRKVVCVPDLATLIQVKQFRRCYAWEIETGSDNPGRVAAKKCQGMYWLDRTRTFQHYFPDSDDMRVVCVCPGSGFRESIRRAMKDKVGKELWLFVDRKDLVTASVLHQPIFYACGDDKPRPLVKPAPGMAPLAAPAGG